MKKNAQVKITALMLAALLITGAAGVCVPASLAFAAEEQTDAETAAAEGETGGDAAVNAADSDADTAEGETAGEPGHSDGETAGEPGHSEGETAGSETGGETGGETGPEEGEGQPEPGVVPGTESDAGTDGPVTGETGEEAAPDEEQEETLAEQGGAEAGPEEDSGRDDPQHDIENIPAGQTEPVSRIAGGSRYETAIAAAERLKTELGVEKFDNIIIASGSDYADALSGSYLAYVKHAPILLVADAYVGMVAEYTIANLKEGGMVYILGGKGAVPKNMEKALPGIAKKRLYGANRYITNVKVLKEAGVTSEDILVCSGYGFADSLSASAAKRPILLAGTSLVPKQRAFLHDLMDAGHTNDFYIIGGRGAVNLKVEDQCKSFGTVTRIQGSNRYKTSVAVAERFFGGTLDTVVLACGTDFPDGLTGGPIASAIGAPMILIVDSYIADAKAYAAAKGAGYAVVMGGKSLISDETAYNVLQ